MLLFNRSALLLLMSASIFACGTTSPSADMSDEMVTATPRIHAPVVLSVAEVQERVAPNQQTSVHWLASGENAYVGRIYLAPYAEVPLHQHDSEEYLYILSGGGTMTIAGQRYDLVPDMVVFVPSRTKHAFVNGPEITTAFQVFASPEGAQRFRTWPAAQGFSMSEEHAPTGSD